MPRGNEALFFPIVRDLEPMMGVMQVNLGNSRLAGRLNGQVNARISPAVSIRRLFAALMAVVVLLGPVLTHAGAAAAAVPDHQMQMMESGHCEPLQSDSSDEQTTDAMTCCIALCTAVPASPPAPVSESVMEPVATVVAVDAVHLSYLREIATPPPRHA